MPSLSPDSLLTWDAIDHDGCGAASGSALAAHGGALADETRFFTNCVLGIVPGHGYSIGAELRFPTGQAETGFMWLGLTWYASATECTGEQFSNVTVYPVATTATPGVWVRSNPNGLTAPTGAHSAAVNILVNKETAGGVLLARFDGVYLVPVEWALQLDGFGTGSACRWSSIVP